MRIIRIKLGAACSDVMSVEKKALASFVKKGTKLSSVKQKLNVIFLQVRFSKF